MPGLTFATRRTPGPPGAPPGVPSGAPSGAPPLAEALADGLRAARFDERYHTRRLLEKPGRLLVSVAYPAYPVASFETRRYRLVLEGRLYGQRDAALEDALARLAAHVFDGRHAQVRRWLLTADGPFLLYFEEKATARWAFLCDVLGRLPVYTWQQPGAFYLSRSFPFFAKMNDGPPVDGLGLAQQLLRGFPLGARTLLRGVCRMQPATLLQGDPGGIATRVLHTFNFEERRHRGRSLHANAQRLAGLLREACTRRDAGAAENVLALSGGLDSRAVALALRAEGRSFRRVTFRRHDGSNRRDVKGAAAIARLCHAPGPALTLAPPTGRSCLRLLQAAGGRNLFDVAYVVDFLEQAQQHFGAGINFLTGDGGGYVMVARHPSRALAGTTALAHYVAGEHWLPPALVARLTGIPAPRLLESLRERLATYPERTPAQKYVHFFLYERLFNFSYIGEDRNRCYFWQSAPLYGLDFFRYAMNCPVAQRTDFSLFRELLLALSPRALDVGYANFMGAKMTPLGYRTYTLLRALVRRLPPLKSLMERWTGRRHPLPPGAPQRACLREQARHGSVVTAFDADALDRFSRASVQGKAWSNLLTATSFLEWRAGEGALDAYRAVPFT